MVKLGYFDDVFDKLFQKFFRNKCKISAIWQKYSNDEYHISIYIHIGLHLDIDLITDNLNFWSNQMLDFNEKWTNFCVDKAYYDLDSKVYWFICKKKP